MYTIINLTNLKYEQLIIILGGLFCNFKEVNFFNKLH